MEETIEKLKVHAGKVKDGAVKITKTFIGKTNNVVSQTKLKFAISETEDKVNEIYAQLGKEIYECYAEGSGEYPDLSEKCEKIDDLHREIENLREQLAELKETVRCPKCDAYNHADDVYCSKCGEKLYSEPDDDDDDVVEISPEDIDID